MNHLKLACAVAAAVLLSGCGGGGEVKPTTPPAAQSMPANVRVPAGANMQDPATRDAVIRGSRPPGATQPQ
jgi:hypothetical protein